MLGEVEVLEDHVEHWFVGLWLGREVVGDQEIPLQEIPVGDWRLVLDPMLDLLISPLC